MVLTHLGKTFFISWFTEATYFKQDEMMDWKRKNDKFCGDWMLYTPKEQTSHLFTCQCGIIT